jgi:hypothetical protein
MARNRRNNRNGRGQPRAVALWNQQSIQKATFTGGLAVTLGAGVRLGWVQAFDHDSPSSSFTIYQSIGNGTTANVLNRDYWQGNGVRVNVARDFPSPSSSNSWQDTTEGSVAYQIVCDSDTTIYYMTFA